MATSRFFCSTSLKPHTTVELPEALAHYAARVLRLKDGASIVLFDGTGGEYPATLSIEGKRAYAKVDAHLAREAELAGELTLVQGLPSGDKMDWIIEKAVELGVTRIVPIAADRSVLQLSGDRLTKRIAHWQRVAESAAEQCGRNRLLNVSPPCRLAQWLETPAQGLRLMCHPHATQSLRQALASTPTQVTLVVGPEGGWSDTEMALAATPTHALHTVRWGDRIMRTETAGLALTSACVALLDWV